MRKSDLFKKRGFIPLIEPVIEPLIEPLIELFGISRKCLVWFGLVCLGFITYQPL